MSLETHGIRLSREQQDAIDLLEAKEWPSQCLFITGRAGTGKSTVLKYFREHTSQRCVVLAPTGVAALNVGGQTIHSFFGLPPIPLNLRDPHIQKRNPFSPKGRILRNVEVVIIDEISMVRADLMDAIDYSLRLNSESPHEPFGGKRILMFGDPLQLEPVVSDLASHELMEANYGSPFFFDALCFRESPIASLVLTQVHRQAQDPEFLFALDRLRGGDAEDVLDLLNSRVSPTAPAASGSVVLTATRAAAESVNTARLSDIYLQDRTYEGKVEGEFDTRDLPADRVLTLKEGAQVMFTKNEADWVNGTMGTVASLEEDRIMVQVVGGEVVSVERSTWEKTVFRWNPLTRMVEGDVVGKYVQFPLRLAWAVTVHKAQGLTFDQVTVDLGRGAFAHGQTYVALSRCRSLAGLTLRRAVRAEDVRVNDAVLQFLREIGA